MSTGYRFYLLERNDHIAAERACDCTNDADALLEADAALQACGYPAVEVWNGPRRVGILSKPVAARCASYRCDITNGEGIVSTHILDCHDDAAAVLAATILMDSRPPHHSAEIWQDARIVLCIPKRRGDPGGI